MKKENVKRYKKTELLELLVRLRTENEELRTELEKCKKQLQDKTIAIETSGSIAEAAMKLSGIFEATQAACDQYAENLGVSMPQQKRNAPAEESGQAETSVLFDDLMKRLNQQMGQEDA